MTEPLADTAPAVDDGATEVQSFIHRARELVVARADFRPLFEAYRAHAERWQVLPNPEALSLMHHALAATCLHLACRPPGEYAAWTLNLHSPPLNVFLAGDNTDFHLTGRVFTEGVRAIDTDRLFLESQRLPHPPTMSVVEVRGRSPLRLWEQFYAKSEQIQARFLDLIGGEHAIVWGLPRSDAAWLDRLDEPGARALFCEPLEPIEKRTYRFGCGCTLQRIVRVLRGLFVDKRAELFGGQDRVETFCPRCGRRWWISDSEFDSDGGRVGLA